VSGGQAHIRTTHVGSLPRPEALLELLRAKYEGDGCDEAALEACCARAVSDTVARQIRIGLDVVNDGEMGKPSYATYVSERLTGFSDEEGEGRSLQDLVEFPAYARRLVQSGQVAPRVTGANCIARVETGDLTPLHREIQVLLDALRSHEASCEVFMTSASPGVIASFQDNLFYPSHEAYIEALAEAMREEYEAIVAAGFTLQLDCPDLAMNRHLVHPTDGEAFLRESQVHVEALNHATRNIDPERMRMHLCWGNYPGPHHLDVPVEQILDLVLSARPAGLAFEAANPRHEHEWEAWSRAKIPDHKILLPGVVDTTTNYVEHPRLVAQRIRRFAEIVGRERVMAGTDCGFATLAQYPLVDPEIAWKKLEALVDGAAIASDELW
jgi:5-methyltetrahydropteroyltriglutamate--homocysteine methyltransferase